MRVTGELDIEAGIRCDGSRAWLMCEQNLQRNRRGRVRCRDWVAAMRGIVVMRALVSDAAEQQRLPIVPQDGVLVEQYVQPEAAPLVHPGIDTMVVLMIASHAVGAVARAQVGQGRDV
jgi:hypothetical protein